MKIHAIFNYPNLKLLHFLIAMLVLSFAACSSYDEYSKKEFLFSDSIGNQLYTESYRVASYGVRGDVYSVYVTDSVYFRKFIAVYYDNESFEFTIDNDHILVIKLEETGGINNLTFPSPTQEYKFPLNSLKNEGKFE